MKKKLWTLFRSTFYLSAFTFGGGYVIVPLMKEKFVEELAWISEDEMTDFIALSQSSPGPIAVNASILVGHKVGGWSGAICAMLGTMLPPMIIISIISQFYVQFSQNIYVAGALRTMQAGVSAIIINVVYGMAMQIIQSKKWAYVVQMIVAFVLAYVLKINVLILILGSVVLGLLRYKEAQDA